MRAHEEDDGEDHCRGMIRGVADDKARCKLTDLDDYAGHRRERHQNLPHIVGGARVQ